MRIKVSLPVADALKVKEKILEGAEKVELDQTGESDWEVVRPSFLLAQGHSPI